MRKVHVLGAMLAAVALGCSNGGGTEGSGGASGSGGTRSESDIEDSLNGLGVDTTKTDRVGPDQEPLPDDYGPLGSSGRM